MQYIDKDIKNVVSKLNKLGIKTSSSCSGCGISHINKRTGFITLSPKNNISLMNDIFHLIYNHSSKINIVKVPFRSRVSTMIYVWDEEDISFLIKVIGKWYMFGYDIKKFWKYLELILDNVERGNI